MIFEPDLNKVYPLDGSDGLPSACHRFEQYDIHAITAALACRRPLLIRGEPGIGKSQLARAVAAVSKVPFLYHTMTAEAECRDLLYSFDAVERLAQAQVLSRVGDEKWRDQLAMDRFVIPGVFWWALHWKSAFEQSVRYCADNREKAKTISPAGPQGWTPEKGCVLLIDEIDKADGDVPNALLESLGAFSFTVPEASKRVRLADGCPPPLIVITTNEERELPRAFLRRCLVLQMDFNRELLLRRGRDHFREAIDDVVYKEAADRLLADREAAPAFGPVTPGLAEYLDLLAIVAERKGKEAQLARIAEVRQFVGAKNPKQHKRPETRRL
jgi:MoxR-like ATPase